MPNTTEIFDKIPKTLNDSQLTEWHPRATSNASKTECFFILKNVQNLVSASSRIDLSNSGHNLNKERNFFISLIFHDFARQNSE